MATYSVRARQATLPAIVGFWVLRGIARQIGFDVRAGSRSSKELFRDWMRRRWQRVPRAVRVSLFAVGVTARAGYRAARYSARTVSIGAKRGYSEGRARHAEFVQLHSLKSEFPKQATHVQDVVGQVKEERKGRKEEHRTLVQQQADQRRAEKAARPPIQWPAPVTVEPSLTEKDASTTPPYPGDPDGGDYEIHHRDFNAGGYSKERAEQMAAWLGWRHPEAAPAVVGPASPPPGSVSQQPVDLDAMQDGKSENTTNGGKVMTAPSGMHGGDVTSVADLRDVYESTGSDMASVQDHQSALAEKFEAQAASYEAAVGGLSSEGFDQETISDATAAMEALYAAAAKAQEAAAAAEHAQGVVANAHKGLERHRPMEEAVAAAGQTAHRTAAYAPR